MIDFQWELKQVVSGIRKGLLEKQVTFFLRPHDAIWGDNSTDFTQLADEIMALLPDKQAQRQFLSVCLGSFLLNPTKAPTIFKDWFLSKITVKEIVGCNVPFDTLLSWSWGRAAFPVVDPRSETDTVYYAMLGCHQENIDVIVPNWINTVLDKKAINAVRVAIYTTKSVYDDKNFYFWPFVNPNRPVHGESHGLPLYLSCMSLASDKQIPLGKIATGAINENEVLSSVAGINRKYAISQKKEFKLFIYPHDDAAYEVNNDLALEAVTTLSEAENIWGVARQSHPTLLVNLSPHIKTMPPAAKVFATLIERKLQDDCTCWYNAQIGGQEDRKPDFLILIPDQGLLVVEIVDIGCNINNYSSDINESIVSDILHKILHKKALAYDLVLNIKNILKRDALLKLNADSDELSFNINYGILLSNITKSYFNRLSLSDILPDNSVICEDELHEEINNSTFAKKLYLMFDPKNSRNTPLLLRKIERIRWHLYPEIRLPLQPSLFETNIQENATMLSEDIFRVMDLKQEQVARSLGSGHRVIHGVAGSGKTMILLYRAKHLAETYNGKIQILCYNVLLALRINSWFQEMGCSGDRIVASTFHSWCNRLIQSAKAYIRKPKSKEGTPEYFDEIVQNVLINIENKNINAGQYDAILIDEGHDFCADWFKIAVSMLNPITNSLLVLYDDAQSIFDSRRKGHFSFKSVGIHAVGRRTTILKINYRNTKEVLECATDYAGNIINSKDFEEEFPIISPSSAGRCGPAPVKVILPSAKEEAEYIVKAIQNANQQGIKWRNMAVLYSKLTPTIKHLRVLIGNYGIPYLVKESATFDSAANSVFLLNQKSSKGLEFEFVAIPDFVVPTDINDSKLLYVAITRSTSRLILTSVNSSKPELVENNSETLAVTNSPTTDPLNKEQRQAVQHDAGPVLICGGAGTGKTYVISHRIKRLIHECGVHPWNILAMTFTAKTAKEMSWRVRRLLGSDDVPLIATFHTACTQILRQEIHSLGYSQNFVIYDDKDSEWLLNELLQELNVDERRFPLAETVMRIDDCKNLGLLPDELPNGDLYDRQFVKLYTAYQERLKRYNALNLGDMILLTVRIFEQHPEVLSRWQHRFQWLLVDDYQDANPIQHRLIRLLTGERKNLCVTVDDDQSIYAWRGADIHNFIEFEKDFSEATIIRLEQNYRSTTTILQAADAVIAHNSDYKPKRLLWTEKPVGELIRCEHLESNRAEAHFVSNEIGILRQAGVSLSEISVLFRTKIQSFLLEAALSAEGIPYHLVRSVPFCDRPEIKDILAYLRLLENPTDDVSLKRVINVPPRGIGAATLERVADLACKQRITLYEGFERAASIHLLNSGPSSKVIAFLELMQRFRGLAATATLPGLVRTILEESGYLARLQESRDEDDRERLENLAQLVSAMEEFSSVNPEAGLADFLEQVALDPDLKWGEAGRPSVSLMTLHAVKGLEFKVVFIVGMEEDLFPHVRALDDPGGIEEERRLFYVGMTSAQERLYLLRTSRRMEFGQEKTNLPSRFLKEIPAELLTHGQGTRGQDGPVLSDKHGDGIYVGLKVRHAKLGVGTIRKIEGSGDDQKVTVWFVSSGPKKMLVRFAGLEPVQS